MNLFDLKEYTVKNDADKFITDFQTPHPVCQYMASLIPPSAKSILEPTAGEGNIVRAIKNEFNKRKDIGYYITAPVDYFLFKKQPFDCIVMNPPFSSKFAFMQNAPEGINKYGMRLGYHILIECTQMSNHIIALMPWFTISDSDVRLRYLKDYGLKSLTALPRKTFKYARIQTMIIELYKGFKGKTEFRVFDRL